MTRWLGLWRVVAGRARSDWAFLAAVWLLIASATTLLAAGTLYADTVEVGGLRRALAEAPPESRAVTARLGATYAETATFDPAIRGAIDRAFAPAGADVALTARSSTLRLIGAAPPDAERVLTALGTYEDIERHAELVEGRWPRPGSSPIEAVVSQPAAELLGLQLGDTLELADASRPGADPTLAVATVALVGTYLPLADDPYWLGDAQEIDGYVVRDSTVHAGPLMIDPADAATTRTFERADATWRGLPRVAELRLAHLDAIRGRLGGLSGAIQGELPDERFVTVNTDLAGVLGTIDRSALVSRGGVVLITLQFGILAAYAVLLVGGILAERRRPEVALLRARGASSAEVGFIALGEACLLAVPAALAAPLLAVGVVELIGGVGALAESGIIAGAQLAEPTLLVALAGGGLCICALVLPALIAEVDLARVRAAIGRPLAQTTAQRLGLDLVVLALAVIGIVQLQSYGSTVGPSAGGELELDPLLVAAPAIALAAGAILVVRFVPRLGQLAEWMVRRGRGLLGSYAARQAARRPLRYTRSALLVVLAAALGTFGAVYSATWQRSQVDQASYRSGADLRVTRELHQGGQTQQMAEQLAALTGVEAISPAVRAQVDVGRAIRRADILAVDPESFDRVARLPAGADEARRLLGELAAGRPSSASIEIPADARWLAVVLDVDIEQLGPPNREVNLLDFPGIQVMPVVEMGGALPERLPTKLAAFTGEPRLVFELPAVDDQRPSAAPPRLVSVSMHVGAPVPAVGELRLVRVETSSGVAPDDWQTLAEPAAMADWSFVFHRSTTPGLGRPIGGSATHDYEGPVIDFTERDPVPLCERWFSGSLAAGCFDEGQDLYRWASKHGFEALPAIASEAFLEASGSAVGDTLSLSWFSVIDVRPIGSVASFPSLDPATPFLIIDRASLDRLRTDRQLGAASPTEWWLSVADGQLADVEAAATRPPIDAAEAISRVSLARSLQRDPIALGLVGALLLGSLAAAVLAGLGLLVTAVVSARERLGEVALLRALGVSRRQVYGLVSIEQLALLTLGLLAGAGLGGLIAVLVLPHAPLNRSGAAVVPSPQIVLPWDLAVLVVLAALAVVALSVVAAQRELSGRPVVDVLRERED